MNVKRKLSSNSHLIINRAEDFNGDYNNTHLVNEEICLQEGVLEGCYTSKALDTSEFEGAVGSWNCITSPTQTVEFKVSVCVNGAWSKYLSYGEWGLGKENYYYNDEDEIASIKVDEIIVNNQQLANKIKYRVILRRSTVNEDSPRFRLAAITFKIPNYNYPVDVTGLPNSVDYDVPLLHQYDVGVVGNVICSATTSTMLLKFKGHDFSKNAKEYSKIKEWGEFEHGYIATLVADPGHNAPTYVNWTYNMATIGALGESAYYSKMYSWEELQYHLATVGPVGIGIRGYLGVYTASGHILVCRGYRIEDDKTIVICNDPAIKGVYYEVPLDVFKGAWKGSVSIVE